MIKSKESLNRGIEIDLTGPDGNAFALMAYAKRFGKQVGMSNSYINEMLEKMMSSDYENLVKVFDDDLRLLMGQEVAQKDYAHKLDYLHVNIGTTTIPTATVRIKSDQKLVEESATGDGPVDACFNAIDRALNSKFHIESYQVRSVTVGRSAQGEAHLRLKNGENIFSGRGISTDIVEASAKAYLQAINESSIEPDVNENVIKLLEQ